MSPLERFTAALRVGMPRHEAWARFLADRAQGGVLGLTEAPICRCPALGISNHDGRGIPHRLGLSSRCRGDTE